MSRGRIFILVMTILYFIFQVYTIFTTENYKEFGLELAKTNLSVSIGLGAVVLAIITLINKSEIKSIRKEIINYIYDLLVFMIANFILFNMTYTDKKSFIIGAIILAMVALIIFLINTYLLLYNVEKKLKV